MDLPSGRRLRRSSPPPPKHGADDPGEIDRISALPDDMLVQILTRMRCACSAARASVLGHRWRFLWTRLPDLVFHDVSAGKIQAALARVALPGVSLLEIHLPRCRTPVECKLDESRAKSLLRATVRLSPEVIVFTLSDCYCHKVKVGRPVDIVLPRFRHATSIELDTHLLRIKPPPTGELPSLEMLSISGNIVDIGALLDRCPRLRQLRVTFRGVDTTSLEAGLAALEAAVAQGLVVSLLGINGNSGRHKVNAARFVPILGAVARIYPLEFIFTNNFHEAIDADMPYFNRATSIEMDLFAVCFTQLPDDKFLALERLSLSRGCGVSDLFTLVTQCPRLLVLKVTADTIRCNNIRIHSASLQELELDLLGYSEFHGIDIVTSMLKKVKLFVYANVELVVSISAPMVETVSLLRMYGNAEYPIMFGFWLLQNMRIERIKSSKWEDDGVLNDKGEVACSQLPRSHVLSLEISAPNRLCPGAVLDIAQEMEKFMVTNISVIELHLNPKGHTFASFVARLLSTRHIRTAARSLVVILPEWSEVSQTSKCIENCPCKEPENWRSENISLNRLEEVEILYFRGGEHEIDFVALILGWAPRLKRMTINLAHELEESERGSCTRTIYNTCLAYPSVKCSVYRISGEP